MNKKLLKNFCVSMRNLFFLICHALVEFRTNIFFFIQILPDFLMKKVYFDLIEFLMFQ